MAVDTTDLALWRRVLAHLRRSFGLGLLILVPAVATYLILRFLFDSFDGLLQPAIKKVHHDQEIHGLGLVILVLLIYLAGIVGANFIGKRLVNITQAALLRVPLIKTIYNPAKQLIESFSGSSGTGFKRVVLFEYPRTGTWTIGFLTNVTKNEKGEALAVVYIPTAPTPQTGWVAILSVDQVYDTDLSVPDAMRMVISGGIISPDKIQRKPLVV